MAHKYIGPEDWPLIAQKLKAGVSIIMVTVPFLINWPAALWRFTKTLPFLKGSVFVTKPTRFKNTVVFFGIKNLIPPIGTIQYVIHFSTNINSSSTRHSAYIITQYYLYNNGGCPLFVQVRIKVSPFPFSCFNWT